MHQKFALLHLFLVTTPAPAPYPVDQFESTGDVGSAGLGIQSPAGQRLMISTGFEGSSAVAVRPVHAFEAGPGGSWSQVD